MCARSWHTVGSKTPKTVRSSGQIFAEKKKNVKACQHYLMKGMIDYACSCRITIDGGIYLEQEAMKSILDLHFNPGKGIAYIQSVAKGHSLLCCCSRPNNETEDIKERELALNATEQTRQFEEYVKYVKGTVAGQPASNYWDLKQNIATYLLIAPELLTIQSKRIFPESCFFVFTSIRVPMYRTYVLCTRERCNISLTEIRPANPQKRLRTH